METNPRVARVALPRLRERVARGITWGDGRSNANEGTQRADDGGRAGHTRCRCSARRDQHFGLGPARDQERVQGCLRRTATEEAETPMKRATNTPGSIHAAIERAGDDLRQELQRIAIEDDMPPAEVP